MHAKAAESERETPQLNQQGMNIQLPLNITHFYCQDVPIVRILYITLTVRHTKRSVSLPKKTTC